MPIEYWASSRRGGWSICSWLGVLSYHSVGKSTLIAAFLSRHPEYAHEPEAFETLGDDIDLMEAGIPTPDGLRTLLEYTVSAVQAHSPKARVVFERSPVDYLAYAAASGSAWEPNETEGFLVDSHADRQGLAPPAGSCRLSSCERCRGGREAW